MEEYELKIAISDTILDMLRKRSHDMSGFAPLRFYLNELRLLYRLSKELRGIKHHLLRMERRRLVSQHDLEAINLLFNQFIANTKKDSAMESLFCRSRNEDSIKEEGEPCSEEGTRQSALPWNKIKRRSIKKASVRKILRRRTGRVGLVEAGKGI